MLVLPAGEPIGTPHGLSHLIQVFCLPGPSPAHPGPRLSSLLALLLADMNYALILPRKSACLAVPSPMPLSLSILTPQAVEELQPGETKKEKEGEGGRKKRRGRGRKHLERTFYILYPIWSQVPVHKDFVMCAGICKCCICDECVCVVFYGEIERTEQIDL